MISESYRYATPKCTVVESVGHHVVLFKQISYVKDSRKG